MNARWHNCKGKHKGKSHSPECEVEISTRAEAVALATKNDAHIYVDWDMPGKRWLVTNEGKVQGPWKRDK